MNITDYEKELIELFESLCKISSETDHEDEKAAFIANWYADNGLINFEIDSVGNVLYFFGVKAYNPIHLFTAHMDTVFSDATMLEPKVEDGNLYCPGCGDNTANLAIMMMTVKYLSETGFEPPYGVIFAADIGEEGLGNLKGIRAIMKEYGVRVEEMVALDLSYGTLINRAVGSKRYEITVTTNGGHAYHDFGNTSAIAVSADIINELYHQRLPHDVETTFNVGKIQGGTGVNVISSSCSFLYEIRSTDPQNIEFMDAVLTAVIDEVRKKGVIINSELLGERPCMSKVDPDKEQFLVDRAVSALNIDAWKDAGYRFNNTLIPGSTDCNIPLSMGIPSLCMGLAFSEGHHTLAEFTRLDSLVPGMKSLIQFVSE
ncbi:MAG: M20/M25/M40 family metallo-hydrolase [Lachnospiraceae bacterium]